MKFRDRLGHLPSLRPGLPPQTETGSVDDPLAAVRARLQAATGRSSEPLSGESVQYGKPAAQSPKLPFTEHQFAEGRIHQRQESIQDEIVGDVAVGLASTAEAELLALLALEPRLVGLDPTKALYIDTETTGLGGAGTVAFLVGLAYCDAHGEWVLEQLFLRHPSEEVALLERLTELVEQASYLVSFNGRSFDLPLLRSRRVMNKLPAWQEPPHLDLLHLARRVHKRRLKRCRLIDVEREVLGFERGEDDIPGVEIAPRYGHFLRTDDEEEIRAVVDHNFWDVMTMVALVGHYGRGFRHLAEDDKVGMGEVFLRSKAHDHAELVATDLLRGELALDGHRIRAHARKAQGDVLQALLDFETIDQRIDDPAVRLTLAKLYEHRLRDYERALLVLNRGTGELPSAIERRRNRLLLKQRRRD